nr:MAG TPA: MepB protein [Caudoviricetes sp.]DAU37296.1 MAG TPA: MepB protein [Caudoviricetes sp.]
MRLGLIIPHKTKVAIALWRRNTKNVPDTEPCRGLLIVHIKTFFYYGLFRQANESSRCYD